MKILITGGAGYIGSTIASIFLDNGHIPIILDSFVTGQRAFVANRICYEGDIADKTLLRKIFGDHPDIYAIVHCAARIIVPESVAKPALYYRENVSKSIDFFDAVSELGYHRLVFSSSASIYQDANGSMVTETSPLKPNCPYARTKYMMEMVFEDICNATSLKGITLRYFNPVGADPKLRSGHPSLLPSHVVGKLVNVALKKESAFVITGTSWPTRDGSGIRDYVHVWDLARAHLLAVLNFDNVINTKISSGNSGYSVINLGTGSGVTVYELLSTFEKVYGQKLPIKQSPPRLGDVAGSYAGCELAHSLLGWKPEKTLEEAIIDALKWGEIRDSVFYNCCN